MLKLVYYKIKNRILSVISAYSKKQYENGKKKYYRYGDEIFYDKKEVKGQLIVKNSAEGFEFWKEQNSYNMSDYFSSRFAKQYELIFEHFLPLLKRDSYIADIGCAAGDWSFRVAPFCEHVDGFDYSTEMVNTAILRAKESKFSNVRFKIIDIHSMMLPMDYDAMMILGVLMYVDDIEELNRIIKKLFNSIKPGGVLVTKDTLNCENKDVVYLYNRVNQYSAVYWSQEKYYEQFEKTGFVLKKELLMDEVSTRRMHFVAKGAIWLKPIIEEGKK